jgi:ferric-dicitrate binding protein FerR (iron transport regulator)
MQAMKTLNLARGRQRENRKGSIFAAAGLNVSLLLALLCVLSIPAWSRTSQQEQPREELGSLTSLGEVYVNDSPISAVSTVSSGDEIRTGEAGEATLALVGKGALKIRPLSQVVLSGNAQYTAELEKGTVLLNSDPGSDGLIVRIGNYVVVPSVRSMATALRLTRAQDGSFLVHCSEGKIDVLTVEGKSGQLLQAGQSLTVYAKSGLLASSPGPKSKRNSHTRWILLGLAGAGAAAAAAFAHGGGNHTVTISGP